jgi:hypothetical protein
LLKLKIVVMGRQISLNKIVEFALQMNSTTRLVACEKILKMHQDLGSGGATKFQAHIK